MLPALQCFTLRQYLRVEEKQLSIEPSSWTSSARRLHWWKVPGRDGAVIEFACVCLHDAVDIPEA